MVKRLPAMQETWVQSLGREDPLEKGMATYSSILAWMSDKGAGAFGGLLPVPRCFSEWCHHLGLIDGTWIAQRA